MGTVAEQLRQGRESRGLSVQQVAEATKMRTDHVRALEQGNYEAFVAPVYIRGFVRAYARLVGLDADVLLGALAQELGQTEKFREPPSLLGTEKTALDAVMLRLSRINWRIALPVTGALIAVLVGLWVHRSITQRRAQDPVAGVAPGVYTPPPAGGGDTLPLPTPPASRR
jgi:cytoskeleton protein RodZ